MNYKPFKDELTPTPRRAGLTGVSSFSLTQLGTKDSRFRSQSQSATLTNPQLELELPFEAEVEVDAG